VAESFDSFAVEPIDQLVNCLIEGGLESNIFRTLENLLTTEQTWDLVGLVYDLCGKMQ
jgi:hypothetical protein